MNNWVHCNRCTTRYQPNVKYFLSECGHIFCANCMPNPSGTTCLVCHKSNNFIEISKDMDSNMQLFFSPYETLLKKLTEVYSFQMQHQTMLMQIMAKKYAFAKKECFNIHQKYKNVAQENKMLKNLLAATGRTNKPVFMTSTPALTSDRSQADSMSMLSSITPYTPQVMPAGAALNNRQQNSSGRMQNYPTPRVPSSAGTFHQQRPQQVHSKDMSSIIRKSRMQQMNRAHAGMNMPMNQMHSGKRV